MQTIVVSKPKNDSIISQFGALYLTFKDIVWGESINFDLRQIEWICPALLLPLSAYITTYSGSFIIDDESKIKQYLEIVKFPSGVDSIGEFERAMQTQRSYIPISVLKKDLGVERERLESMFTDMLFKVLPDGSGTRNAIYYPIGELAGNIFEHSGQKNGYLFGQFFPNKDWLDICIVDTGRGLVKTYRDEKGLSLSDSDAISEAMKGNSTKSNKERGYGLWTSKNLVCEGLDGQFLLLSGSAALFSQRQENRLVDLPSFNWQGVVISYRIPRPKKVIDFTKYIE